MMVEKKCKIDANSTWQELTPGGTIYDILIIFGMR